jgi:hypothetical protein
MRTDASNAYERQRCVPAQRDRWPPLQEGGEATAKEALALSSPCSPLVNASTSSTCIYRLSVLAITDAADGPWPGGITDIIFFAADLPGLLFGDQPERRAAAKLLTRDDESPRTSPTCRRGLLQKPLPL